MSRDLETAADSALQASHVSQILFLEFDFASGASRVCSREHDVEWNGYTWVGAGRVGQVEPVGEGGELEARGLAMTLSALPSGLLATALTPSEYKGRNVSLWFGQLNAQFNEKNVHPNPLDLYTWASAGAAVNCTLASDASKSSPVGGVPLKMTTTANDPYTATYNTAPWSMAAAAAGEAWTASAYVYCDLAQTVQLFLFEANASGAVITNSNATVALSPGWSRIEVNRTLTGIATAYVQARLDGSNTVGHVVWWDGMQVERSALATPFGLASHIIADPIGPFIFKMDQLTYQLGQSATLRLTAESRLADWARPRVRRYNNADHQALHAGDRFFEHTEKQIEAVYRW